MGSRTWELIRPTLRNVVGYLKSRHKGNSVLREHFRSPLLCPLLVLVWGVAGCGVPLLLSCTRPLCMVACSSVYRPSVACLLAQLYCHRLQPSRPHREASKDISQHPFELAITMGAWLLACTLPKSVPPVPSISITFMMKLTVDVYHTLKVFLPSRMHYHMILRSNLALVLGREDQGRADTLTALADPFVIEGVAIRGRKQMYSTPRLREVNVDTAGLPFRVLHGLP